MIDSKDIITKHSALEMGGMRIAETLGVRTSGVNDFFRAFKACKALRYPFPWGSSDYGRAAEDYRKKIAVVGRDLSYEHQAYEA